MLEKRHFHLIQMIKSTRKVLKIYSAEMNKTYLIGCDCADFCTHKPNVWQVHWHLMAGVQ